MNTKQKLSYTVLGAVIMLIGMGVGLLSYLFFCARKLRRDGSNWRNSD